MSSKLARGERVAPRASVGHRHGAWVVTVVATAASTYALDAFAIAIGALVAASGFLTGLDRPLLLGFLAASYVAWGVGMRANLAANWSLLACTGVSTNVLPKAAHDVAHARAAGLRAWSRTRHADVPAGTDSRRGVGIVLTRFRPRVVRRSRRTRHPV
jgi:hypothetical protein